MYLTRVFILFYLLTSFFVSSQEDHNKRDLKGKKQGHWIYYGKDRPGLGFDDDIKYEEGLFKNDRKEGLWVVYHKDGKTPKLKAIYVNNRPYGAYEKFYSNGKKKEQGSIINNSNLDSIVKFHPNGKIKYAALINIEGNENGEVKYYYSNGNLEFEYSTINGSPNGGATLYFEDGTVKKRMEYTSANEISIIEEVKAKEIKPKTVTSPSNDKLLPPKIKSPRTKGAKFLPNGRNKCYNKNGEIWQDGLFKNGRLWEGRVFQYDSEGIVTKVKIYKEGRYLSDGVL